MVLFTSFLFCGFIGIVYAEMEINYLHQRGVLFLIQKSAYDKKL